MPSIIRSLHLIHIRTCTCHFMKEVLYHVKIRSITINGQSRHQNLKLIEANYEFIYHVSTYNRIFVFVRKYNTHQIFWFSVHVCRKVSMKSSILMRDNNLTCNDCSYIMKYYFDFLFMLYTAVSQITLHFSIDSYQRHFCSFVFQHLPAHTFIFLLVVEVRQVTLLS